MEAIRERDPQYGGWRQTFALVALVFSILTVVWFAAAALGSKYGLWSWTTGLGKMTGNVNAGWGRYVLGVAAALTVLALIFSLIKAPRKRPFILSLAALVVTGLVAGNWLGYQMNARSLPPIHDVQTDWNDPIMPSEAMLRERGLDKAMNKIERAPAIPAAVDGIWPGYGGKSVKAAQEENEQDPALNGKDAGEKKYPPLNTLKLDVPPDAAFAAAQAVANDKGWDTVYSDLGAGVLEATETTGWFGFRDDVMVRVRSSGSGSAVDVRSVSRVGLSDLGANAERVAKFLEAVRREARS